MKQLIYFLGLCGILYVVSSQSDPCRHGWYNYNGDCYMFSIEQETWIQSEFFCRVLGGHLAEIHDTETNTFLKNTAKTKNSDKRHHYFVGLTDEAQFNRWEWAHSAILANYTDWGNRQPDHFHNDENCVLFYAEDSYRWHDANCDSRNYFICQEEAFNSGGGSAIIG